MAQVQLESECQVITVDFVLSVDETAQLVREAASGDRSRLSLPCFGQKMWCLELHIAAEQNNLGLYLTPKALPERTTVRCEAVAYVDDKLGPKLAELQMTHDYPPTSEKSSEWGWATFMTPRHIRRIGRAKLALHVKLTIGEIEIVPAPPSLPDFFDDPVCCDVSLSIRGEEPYLFVHDAVIRRSKHFRTVLDSDFQEGVKTVSRPPARSARPLNSFAGDPGDMDVFMQASHASSSDQPGALPPMLSDAFTVPPFSRTSQAGQGQSLSSQHRRYRSIEVTDCSFATLRAFVYYFYSGSISFLPSLALFLADQAAAGKHPRRDDAQKWLITKADTKEIAPVNPHALYRLADCYLHAELKRLAKNAILESITVESAPFELFSDLSRQYEDFRESILNFVQANLALVKATPGWKLAIRLIDDGEILGAGTVLDRLT